MRRGGIYDAVVIGGAFTGAALAVLLRRRCPDARVLVVERSTRFERKVGEATVEVSGLFLADVLGLRELLAREHLSKHGLRFWFTDGASRRLDEMTEVGTDDIPSLPSFQLDRAALDESLLALAAEEGAEVVRPARIADVDLSRPESTVVVRGGTGDRVVRARWVLDASGRQAFIGRRLGLIKRFDAHPTAAAWARWEGVANLDGAGPAAGLPPIAAERRLATNHFAGRGWWCWLIPLSGGETSVGVVYDERHAELPDAGTAVASYEAFVRRRDGLCELLNGARIDAADFHMRRHLAYRTSRHVADGWALVGDAASFLDPLYSPGLDHCATSAYATARLVGAQLAGELDGDALATSIDEHNARFARSYERMFAALYEDKYELLGDAELTAASFYLDTAMYYLGVVHPAYADADALHLPVLCLDSWKARLALRLLRAQRRRLVTLARRRMARGTYGRRNVGEYVSVGDFGDASLRLTRAHRKGLALWLGAELRDLRERAMRPRRARERVDGASEASGAIAGPIPGDERA